MIIHGVQFAPQVLGREITLPDIAAPPRIEIFVVLLLLPSALFITQAGYTTKASTQALAAVCLVIAAIMISFGLGWVVITQLLVKKNIRFVTFASATTRSQMSSGMSDGLVAAKRKSSHGAFLVERDMPDQARPSEFGCSSLDQLAVDDTESSEAGDDAISATPAGNTIQLFAEAQGATRRVWGSSIGPDFAAEVLAADLEADTFSGEVQPSHAVAEGLVLEREQTQNMSIPKIGDRGRSMSAFTADRSPNLQEVSEHPS